MIKNINNQEVYKKGYSSPSYKAQNTHSPSFNGVVEAATSVLQFCNTNPMAGVSLIDTVTAIAPRTIVDAKTNGFAAAETMRRESSGLIVNCLIPGFVVLGVAKIMEFFNKGANKGMSKMWANQESLETMLKHFIKSDKTANGFVDTLLNDAEVLNSKGANQLNKNAWVKLDTKLLETEISEYKRVIKENIKDKKIVEQARKGLYNKILEVTGGAEHIKINGKIYHDNISTLLRDGVDVGQKFVELKDVNKVKDYIRRATKFVNKKSLIGLGIVIPLAASMQSINRWITRKTSGQEGAPIYKDFVQNNTKKEMTPAQKSKFMTSKLIAAGTMVGVAILSMMKKPSLKMLQFTKNMPSMDQCRWIAATTFASRMLVAEDKNELAEATWRDIATFSSLYFLGDYVSKGVGTIIQKVKGVPLLNYMTDAPKTNNPLKKFAYWVKETKLKSFDEANAIKATESVIHGTKAKHLRAICELSSLGFSMLILGVLVPWYVRSQTNKKHQKELLEKYNSFHLYPSLNLASNKKTFQAFGMMMTK